MANEPDRLTKERFRAAMNEYAKVQEERKEDAHDVLLDGDADQRDKPLVWVMLYW